MSISLPVGLTDQYGTHHLSTVRVDTLDHKRRQADHQRRQCVHFCSRRHRVKISSALGTAPVKNVADRDPQLEEVQRKDDADQRTHPRLLPTEVPRRYKPSHPTDCDSCQEDLKNAAADEGACDGQSVRPAEAVASEGHSPIAATASAWVAGGGNSAMSKVGTRWRTWL